MHIPKTGGHTLRAVLSTVYGDALCPAQNWAELAKVNVSKYRVFIGHFGYEMARETFGDADFATFLREPNERLLSLYHYLQRTEQIDADASLETYLNEIAPRRGEQNQIMQYLGGDVGVANDILRGCMFVGWFENFEVEIERLAHTLDWSNVPPIPHLNTDDTERLPLNELTAEERDWLRDVNLLDTLIYEYTQDKIWSKVA